MNIQQYWPKHLSFRLSTFIRVSLLLAWLVPVSGLSAASFGPDPLPHGAVHFTWHKDDRAAHATPLMPVDTHLCYLSGVSGNFRGRGESVMVYTSENDHWLLGSTNLSDKALSAEAVCVPFSSIEGGFTYWTTTSWASLRQKKCGFLAACALDYGGITLNWAGPNGFCYLTGMGGEFNGDGEWVAILRSPDTGEHNLTIMTGKQGADIRGEANCIAPDYPGQAWNAETPLTWYQGQPSIPLIKAEDGFCVLDRIQGEFAGFGESVSIQYNSRTGYWFLSGRSDQEGLGGRASCFYYNF